MQKFLLMRSFIITFYFLLLSTALIAQQFGSIVGTVTDQDMNNDPLPFANIAIEGTNIGTTTDFDGLFELPNLETGTYTVIISFVGYESQRVSVDIEAEKVTEITVNMGAIANSLDEVVVTTVARKDSQTALLLDQKNALVMKQEIGAQEISSKGLGDAAAAVVKTTGVSRQEGSGTILVRGLGDRYNITLYNGLPLPSNNPSKKNISLDLFTTDIVRSISIDKTFLVTNYGDYAGASVNINAKKSVPDQKMKISIGNGLNTESFGVDTFYLNEGPNRSGFYTGNYPKDPLTAFRFQDSFDRQETFGATAPINTSLGLQLSHTQLFDNGHRLSVFGVTNHDNGFSYTSGVSRGSINTSGLIFKDFDFQKFQYQTNTTAMLNLSYDTDTFNVSANSLLVNSSDQNQQEFLGTIDVFDYAPEGGGYVQRSVFERTTLLVNQLLGTYRLSNTTKVDVGLSYNIMDNHIPDRRQTTLTPADWDEPEGPLSFAQTLNSGDNHRFFQNLSEEELAANFKIEQTLGLDEDDNYKLKISAGYNGRIKDFDFDATQFNFAITRRRNGQRVTQPLLENPYDIDAYFNQENFEAGLFDIRTFRGRAGVENVLDPQIYFGDQDIHAGYASFEYNTSEKSTLLFGARLEAIIQRIGWSTTLDPSGDEFEINKTEFLPSLSYRYKLNEKQNLRFSASKTYTLPQIKERALFQFEEVTQVYIGNPALYASTDYNIDVKWELFPTASELLSVGLFGKRIENPINDAGINSASNDISYINSGDVAIASGIEIEMRKSFLNSSREVGEDVLKENLDLAFNFSYLYSNQKLDPNKVLTESEAAGVFPLSVDFTKTEDKLTGASDILLNIDAIYYKDLSAYKNIQAALAFNYFSDRIYALGTEGRGNLVDKGIPTLNLIFKSNLSKNFGVSLNAQNILNPEVNRFQEKQNVTILSYKKGINISAGVNYRF